MPWRARLLLCGIVVVAAAARPAAAQLISPGKLSAAHESLEGMRNCTACHRLRERGVAGDLCLTCHEPEQTRIAQQRGYHATLAGRDCAECHKEHFGREFQLVRFDTTGFDHGEAGFTLVERHAELGCRECHQPALVTAPDVRSFKGEHGALARTYLGLGTECLDCHEGDDPHGEQFAGRACTECHSQTAWTPVTRIDHDRTRYPLTGQHRDVECERCHVAGRGRAAAQRVYVDLDFASCTACHRDPHASRMGSDCERCHDTAGWSAIPRAAFERNFDHSVTRFALHGAHRDARCATCHSANAAGARDIRLSFRGDTRGRRYPVPAAAACESCHLDYHQGAFRETAGGAGCRNCHTENDWIPTTFDVGRHNTGDTYALTGAHLAVPCNDCHRIETAAAATLQFRLPHDDCLACHERDDPHGGQFAGRRCADCHATESFRIARFDHDATRYRLDGRHQRVACEACHVSRTDSAGRMVTVYRPLGMECDDCHGGGTP